MNDAVERPRPDPSPLEPSPLDPSPLEIATLLVLGHVPGPTHEPRATLDRSPADPLMALERAVLPALRRPPCVVSFSGGMDSTFILAVADRVARREGLPAPIPVTWRFADAPRAEESAHQDRVIAALGLKDWTILRARDELDFVGPVAAGMLTRHGVLLPPNLHFHLPIIEGAAGGSVITGVGGDQLLIGFRRVSRYGPLHRPSTLLRMARARLRARRQPPRFPWLRPEARADMDRAWRAELKAEPRAGNLRVQWQAGRRDNHMICAGMSALGADHDVAVLHPFLDPGFVAAFAAQCGGRPLGRRDELLARIANGALAPAATRYRGKASFNEVFLRSPTREFVSSWDGTGVDEDVVDVDALRAAWSDWPVPLLSAGLVQQAWLAAAVARSSPELVRLGTLAQLTRGPGAGLPPTPFQPFAS